MKRRPGKRDDHPRPGTGARSAREIVTLYEDEAVIAISKPAGLAAVPVKGSSMPSAWAVVDRAMRERRERAFVVHRIDRFTSGIMLFAKTDRDRDVLVEQFLAHTPVREYMAVVRGELRDDAGALVHYLRRKGMFQTPARPTERDASRAELKYVVERRLEGATLVRVTLVTGLQNQIRVQFSEAGHPVVGDRKYHPKEAEEQRIGRVALHASRLEFAHPRTGKSVVVKSPPPPDFRSLVNALAPKQARG